MYGELYIPRERPQRDWHGRWVKGCAQATKGKTWDEIYGKRKADRKRKFMSRLKKRYPIPNHRDGGNQRSVVGVLDNGKWFVFKSLREGGKAVNRSSQSVYKCCNKNNGNLPCTDYRCGGVRFYYEDNRIWLEKIKQ